MEMIKIWAKLLVVLQGKCIILSVIKAFWAKTGLSSGYLDLASFSQRLKMCQIIARLFLVRKNLIYTVWYLLGFFFLHLLELPGTCLRCVFAQ